MQLLNLHLHSNLGSLNSQPTVFLPFLFFDEHKLKQKMEFPCSFLSTASPSNLVAQNSMVFYLLKQQNTAANYHKIPGKNDHIINIDLVTNLLITVNPNFIINYSERILVTESVIDQVCRVSQNATSDSGSRTVSRKCIRNTAIPLHIHKGQPLSYMNLRKLGRKLIESQRSCGKISNSISIIYLI